MHKLHANKILIIRLAIALLLLAGYFLLAQELPHYKREYIFFIVLLFADLYLWSALRKSIFSYKFWLKTVVTFVFWLPLMMVIFFIIGAAIVPIINWNDTFRTFWIGFIVVFYTAKILPLFFLILADLVRIIKKAPAFFTKENREEIRNQSEGISRSKFLQYMGYLSGGLVLGTMLTGMFKWVYDFNIVKKQLRYKRLPKAFDGFKIVQISDLHLGSWDSLKPLEEAVKHINNLKADIVLFTGDLVNYSTREALRFAPVLKEIKAPFGIFATLGNHDYGDYVSWPSKAAKQKNMNQLFMLYKDMGWKLMNNTHTMLKKDGAEIALIGVENWGAHARFPKRGDIKKAAKGINPDTFKVLMSHDPTHWDNIIIPENYDIDLTLSGHTHGFQFGIESRGFKWSPAQYLYKEWAGLYTDNNSSRQIYVNRGLGSIGYPGRIGILPEITLLQLKSEA